MSTPTTKTTTATFGYTATPPVIPEWRRRLWFYRSVASALVWCSVVVLSGLQLIEALAAPADALGRVRLLAGYAIAAAVAMGVATVEREARAKEGRRNG